MGFHGSVPLEESADGIHWKGSLKGPVHGFPFRGSS
jgi:hypothetical protein